MWDKFVWILKNEAFVIVKILYLLQSRNKFQRCFQFKFRHRQHNLWWGTTTFQITDEVRDLWPVNVVNQVVHTILSIR